MPFDLSYTDVNGRTIKLKFDDWCNPDGTLKQGEKDSLLEENFPGITSFIAYRIPTEEKYSMINMKVVRFSRQVNGGGIIKVPAQGTTIAGFDFDADKLFFMKREYRMQNKTSIKDALKIYFKTFPEIGKELREAKKASEGIGALLEGMLGTPQEELSILDYVEGAREKFEAWYANNIDKLASFESYDYSKNPWNKSNTRTARNNMLINIIQKRLEDPQTLKERTTPGGFDHIKDAAKLMREWLGIEGINYIYSDPWTMVIYNQQNQIADKLIGIFANQNANHNIAMLMSTFALKNPISFGKHSAEGLYNLKNTDSLTKELLAASVDAVKDPQLVFLNLNTTTATSASLLCRLGYDFEEIGALFNQPIIKDFCKYCDDFEFSDFDTAIANIASDKNWNIDLSNPKYNSALVSFDALEYCIKTYKETNNKESIKTIQAEVLKLFVEIYKAAQEVSEFVTNTKFTASNAVKSTFGGMYAQIEKVLEYNKSLKNNKDSRLSLVVNDRVDSYGEPYIDSPVSNMFNLDDRDAYFKRLLYNPFGYEQAMYDANNAALRALNKYYPYDTTLYRNIRNVMKELSLYALNEDTINDIHKYVLKYLTSLPDFSMFNPEGLVRIKDVEGNIQSITNKEYYTKYVPFRVLKTIRENPSLKNEYSLLEYLRVSIIDDSPVINLGDNGALENMQEEAVRDSWGAMLDRSDLRAMAIDIYMYSYYMSGFGFGTIGFNHLAPTTLKQALTVGDEPYLKFLHDILNKDIYQALDYNTFAFNFIKNHKNNKAFVYNPKDIQLDNLRKLVIGENKILKKSFTVSLDSKKTLGNFDFIKMKSASSGGVYVLPAIDIDGALYVCNLDNILTGSEESSFGVFNYMPEHVKEVTYYRIEDVEESDNDGTNYNDSFKYTMMYTREELSSFEEDRLWEILVEVMPDNFKSEGSTVESIIEDLKESNKGATKDDIIDNILNQYDSNKVVDRGTGKFTC